LLLRYLICERFKKTTQFWLNLVCRCCRCPIPIVEYETFGGIEQMRRYAFFGLEVLMASKQQIDRIAQRIEALAQPTHGNPHLGGVFQMPGKQSRKPARRTQRVIPRMMSTP
jgi:hypothetical protein